jgi:transposase
MTTWLHERLLRRPQTKSSLRRRTRHVQKPGDPHLRRKPPSVKRYVKKADHGESLAPKKSPGSLPKLDEKASRVLGADLAERPYLTLQERRGDYIEAVTGLSVSRSTVCRAIARMGSTRKKGRDTPPSATSSRGQLGS